MQLGSLHALLLLLPLLTTADIRQWNSGLNAKVCTTTSDQICGFEGTLTFTGPVTGFNAHNFIVDDRNARTTTVTLRSQSWYADFSAGSEICLEFNTQKVNTGVVYNIEGLTITKTTPCSGGAPATTRRQTTQAVTTQPSQTTKSSGSGKGPSGSGNYNLSKVLDYSILFYEAQRSGRLPADNRVSWRHDSTENDGQDNGVDLEGGWFDAGDYVKFNFPMAWSTTVLAWGLSKFKAGYEAAGQLANMYDSIRWPLDYLLKCWDEDNQIYWAQVGDGDIDHAEWTRAEDLKTRRPSYAVTQNKPGSDVAGETAAAFAAASIVFKGEDPAYSATLLEKAKTLFDFALRHQGSYTGAVPNVAKFYNSWSGYRDELCWAAAWLYKATNNTSYKTTALKYLSSSTEAEFSWDNKNIGCQVLLYSSGEQTLHNIEGFMNNWMTKQQTPHCRLAWHSQWGPLRYTANAAFIALMAAEEKIKPVQYREWALSQIEYMLGSNEQKRSYVVGFGNNPPVRAHHRGSSCPTNQNQVCDWAAYNSPSANPNVLYGALVGGPNQYGDYTDARSDYKANEVACDYNAGFQSAIAGLLYLQKDGVKIPRINAC